MRNPFVSQLEMLKTTKNPADEGRDVRCLRRQGNKDRGGPERTRWAKWKAQRATEIRPSPLWRRYSDVNLTAPGTRLAQSRAADPQLKEKNHATFESRLMLDPRCYLLLRRGDSIVISDFCPEPCHRACRQHFVRWQGSRVARCPRRNRRLKDCCDRTWA